METMTLDPVVRGEDGGTLDHMEERFARFQNKHTWWRHDQAGVLDDFHRRYDEAVNRVRGQLGQTLPLGVAGKEVDPGSTFSVTSPADRSLVVGHYAKGKREHVREALVAAKAAQPDWEARPWQERAAVLERAAELFVEHYYDLCAVMSFETGKSRFESSIDVDEAVDFLRFYAFTMREMGGFDMTMGKPVPQETCRSVRRPWGVFGVVCPFNFPVAITAGMTAAALVTGNAVLMKPSMKGCLSGWWVFRLLRQAGVPEGVLHFLTGPDEEVGAEFLENADLDGLVFTGSKRVGAMAMQKSLTHGRPKPVIAEMGGKNCVIVTDKADLDKAVQGVYRAAFGFSGQKCSACSRAYVHKDVAKEFLERLAKLAEATPVGEPWRKESFMGPVIEAYKVDLLKEVAAQVKKDGGTVVAGGTAVDDLDGNYVRPTIVTGLPKDHRVFREEFFMPFVAVAEVEDLDEAIGEANAVEYGLTAGIMSEDPAEVEQFFAGARAGVVYANRAAGACTAAVVNGQSFVGWKNSGSTGNGAGGRYYLQQFTREQSRTVVE